MTALIWLVAGEESGDLLGARLIEAARTFNFQLEFQGVGGARMEKQGLKSLFPLSDISVMGLMPVLQRLPLLIRRVHQTVDAIVATRPDVLVIIDSPEFTHAVARRVRKKLPNLRIIDYVSPSVWAWRSGRAKKMRGYIDHVLAILPFEPEVHRKLGGPACTYIGHPLLERLDELVPCIGERQDLKSADSLNLLILPGSRRSEVSRLLDVFGEAAHLFLGQVKRPVNIMIPAVDHVLELIREKTEKWPTQPDIIQGETEKYAAFRKSHLALAASGTVTLELALSGIPMVVGYKLSWAEYQLRHIVKVTSIVLPNLILGENKIPEFIQDACNPQNLSQELLALESRQKTQDLHLVDVMQKNRNLNYLELLKI